ncbi:MAG TPA: NADH-ubiquinone oxidoreductase-F iron-sulfur binding region domain-containing protein [Candidatus Angelobacter sp.]|nr:NADH-ubiquinone oxidoreductase-F iron-sulfur binding region domain-containing protein [Candidatus Angelobacter sp.]
MSGPAPFKVLPVEHKTDGIFEELEDIQRKFDYLPADELKRVAERREMTARDVHAVASYYPRFRLVRPARVTAKVCDDMTCHLRGAPALRQKLEQRFQGLPEKEFAIRAVSCLGRCDHAPSFVINERFYDGLTPDQAVTTVADTLNGAAPVASSYGRREMRLATDPYENEKPYFALQKFVRSGDWPGLLAAIKAAGLRGMGGAGYPTNQKWEHVRHSPSPDKYIICNADESEPGTIKDRFILTQMPHLVVEGMVLAGLVTGAKRGYFYIRHEYHEQEEIIRAELIRAQQNGWIGERILGTDLSFEITLFVSPGGYICGEETALLEAIEGKRAEPRNKPPFMAVSGLWGKPTIIDNVETLALAAAIAMRGADWFNSFGANGFTGLKFISVTGDVEKPGVYEVPMGTKYSDLIRGAGGVSGGRKLLGFAPSGPSSGYLPASMADLPMEWQTMNKAGSMVGSGAIVVCAEDRCMLDMALNAVRFFRNESCGKCVPCRIGSQKLVEILEAWTSGGYQASDIPLVEELFHTLKQTSICGLGQFLPAPIRSVLQHFRPEVDEHLLNRRCSAGVCFKGKKP